MNTVPPAVTPETCRIWCDHIQRKLAIRTPYRAPIRTNRDWLERVVGDRARFNWDREKRVYHVAHGHYLKLVYGAAEEFKMVRVWVRADSKQTCDSRCQDARGDECECVCGGAFHGQGQGLDWIPVGDTALVRHEVHESVFVVRRKQLIPHD